jgi:hypothetical protein
MNPRTHLMALLVIILWSKNKENTNNFEILHPRGTPTVGKYQHYLHGSGFLGSESSVYENSHATEVKCSHFPQKSSISHGKRSEMNVKAAEIQSFLATIPHFPAETTFDQSFFTIQMSLGVSQSKIFHENESRKILL